MPFCKASANTVITGRNKNSPRNNSDALIIASLTSGGSAVAGRRDMTPDRRSPPTFSSIPISSPHLGRQPPTTPALQHVHAQQQHVRDHQHYYRDRRSTGVIELLQLAHDQ